MTKSVDAVEKVIASGAGKPPWSNLSGLAAKWLLALGGPIGAGLPNFSR
jgi:hypothetical protein